MKVLKFGGTSVGSPERMKKLLDIINPNERQIVVLSAVSGTTNSLVEIASFYHKKDAEGAKKAVNALKDKYNVFIRELFVKEEFVSKGQQVIDSHFELLGSFSINNFGEDDEKVILAQGELLSTTFYQLYLTEIGVKSVWLPALDFMKIDEDNEPVIPFTTEKLTPLLEQNKDVNLFITQGYICKNSQGKIDNLRRGGSDYTASLVGAAILAEEVQIWTDIDGMHNNDPRIVKGTKPIAQLSFNEAAELAYFGAKILHPQSVFPAQKYKIPVRLLNTMEPSAKGTLITNESEKGRIKSIAAKDGIVIIRLHSSRMLLAYGFLRKIFEVFERYKTPIDVITTSEVEVSLTIDETKHLNEITKELSEYAGVEVVRDQTIVCVVGDCSTAQSGVAVKIFEAFTNIPINMISYGASDCNVTILVNTPHKEEALRSLHSKLFQ